MFGSVATGPHDRCRILGQGVAVFHPPLERKTHLPDPVRKNPHAREGPCRIPETTHPAVRPGV